MGVEFLKRVQAVIWNKKFFKSQGEIRKKPLFGLAPESARGGDVICVLLGCSVPVILRPCHSLRRDYFEFVGEAYVYGIMDGEALNGRDLENPETWTEEFELR